MKPTDPTTAWYNTHAGTFAERTQALDMTHLYGPFLARLHESAKILDAGCGAGRDSKAFIGRGYDVTLLDASAELAKVAEAFTGQSVHVARFQEIVWENTFDGVWACASLLHVPERELPGVFERLARALKRGGVLYASFKQGGGERLDTTSGRTFTDMDVAKLRQLALATELLEPLELWTNDDSRGEQHAPWVNGLFRRR